MPMVRHLIMTPAELLDTVMTETAEIADIHRLVPGEEDPPVPHHNSGMNEKLVVVHQVVVVAVVAVTHHQRG